jgi:hypothetical protein
MALIANPTFVIANGGTSVVTAILVEPAGTFVPDGVEVFFFTNLGRVDASGKTVNGVARVNFVSDARSGIATVIAVSGGPAPAPSASPTPAAGTGFGASAVGVGVRPPAIQELAIAAAGENSATVDIRVGSANPKLVLVAADPPVLGAQRSSRLTATVFDKDGNPVQNVPVALSLDETAQDESLDSGGAFQYTNSNGQVFDTLRTRALSGVSATVTVTATTANGITGTVVVGIQIP